MSGTVYGEQVSGTALEGSDVALAVLLTRVNEGFAAREHEIDHARQLVCHGRVDARLVHAVHRRRQKAPSAESLCDRLMAANFSAWLHSVGRSLGLAGFRIRRRCQIGLAPAS